METAFGVFLSNGKWGMILHSKLEEDLGNQHCGRQGVRGQDLVGRSSRSRTWEGCWSF